MLSAPPKPGPDNGLQLHASTVAFEGRAVAFCGPAGTGKTGAALALLSRGATLLADDITWLRVDGERLIAHCPPELSGKIEARSIGILAAPMADPTPLSLIVDLGTPEQERIPPRRSVTLLGCDVPILRNPKHSQFFDAVLHYLRYGRAAGSGE